MGRNVYMTEEQIETLKIQIAAYETLSEQFAEMCRAHLSAPQASLVREVKPVNMYGDTSKGSVGPKLFIMKQRWTPTPVQLQILERIFKQVTGTPKKEMIKEIAAELAHHGQISEKNVFNWFQNKRARSKKRHRNVVANSVNTKPQAETDQVDNFKVKKKTKLGESQSQPSVTTGPAENDEYLQYLNNPEFNQPDSMFPSDVRQISTGNFAHVPHFNGMLSGSNM